MFAILFHTEKSGTMDPRYWIYMLECDNGHFYTGIALDLPARYRLHHSGGGAKFTRMHPPLGIAQCWRIDGGRGDAMKIESVIKSMNRGMKEKLITRPSLLCLKAREKLPQGREVHTVSRSELKRINKQCNALESACKKGAGGRKGTEGNGNK